jgi:endonuclease/exonuclease/phosphatase family metal-dependent hydrolase
MRLATWNILHGRTTADSAVDGDRFAGAVAALGADVLALQEVDRGLARSGMLDLAAIAAEAMGGAAARFAPALIGDPAGEWRPADDADLETSAGGYGVALVSREPVLRWHVLRLEPSERFRVPYRPAAGGVVWVRDEPRVAVAATIRTAAGERTVAATHLSFVPGVNVRQLRRTVRWLEALPGPRLLLGDLNLPNALARRATGWHPLAEQRTFPADRPLVQLDHVLSDEPLPARRVRVPRPPLSDHLPLVVEL